MRYVTILILLALAGRADAAPGDAVGYIRDAIDAVDDHGGKCKRDVIDDLQEIKDLLNDEAYDRALRHLKTLRKIDRCPAHVEKLVRQARKALEATEPPPAPKRPAGVVFRDWHQDCRDEWMIIEIARNNTTDATLDKLAAMFRPACENPGMGAANYPNGQTAKTTDGAFYYPNGQTAKSADGAFYYPNGQTARSASGEWYYPNGQTAKATDWYYYNGASAGGWEALVAHACARSEPACAAYKLALNSDVEEWRTLALVKLVSKTR